MDQRAGGAPGVGIGVGLRWDVGPPNGKVNRPLGDPAPNRSLHGPSERTPESNRHSDKKPEEGSKGETPG